MKTDNKRLVIGIPCVGGKSKLADVICSIIEKECARSDIHRYVSACGGGGKDIFSLSHLNFDELVYNEYEFGMYALVKALNEHGLDEILDAVYEKLTNMDISDSDSTEVRKTKYESLFNTTAEEVNRYSKADLKDKDTCINVAACQVILIFGSHQNNRISVNASKLESVIKQHSYAGVLHDVWFRAKDLTDVTCEDCIEVVKNAEDNTFVYIDPPYWGSTNDYKTAFNTTDHLRLIDACIKASDERKNLKIMISMHEFSHAPYTLKLYELERAGKWYMYSFDSIKHDTRNNNKLVSLLSEYIRNDGQIDVKAVKKIIKDNSSDIAKSDFASVCVSMFNAMFFNDEAGLKELRKMLIALEQAVDDAIRTKKKKELNYILNELLNSCDNKSVPECVWCNFKIENNPNVYRVKIADKADISSKFPDTKSSYLEDGYIDLPEVFLWEEATIMSSALDIEFDKITKALGYNNKALAKLEKRAKNMLLADPNASKALQDDMLKSLTENGKLEDIGLQESIVILTPFYNKVHALLEALS